MGAPEVHGGRPGASYDAAWWAAVHALFDEAFPGLPAGIARAAGVGAAWPDWTTPFTVWEGDRCVAHVGVLVHPVIARGAHREMAGIHAVCTAADRRRRGLCRAALAAALEWVDARYDVAKLMTDDPPVYAGHGFRVVPTWAWDAATAPGPAVRTRPLTPAADPAHAARLRAALAGRTAPSATFATADDGWLVLTDAALQNRLDDTFVELPDHGTIVAARITPTHIDILDVIAATLPPAHAVLAALPADRPVRWTFSPDLLDPTARPVPLDVADVGALMVRGTWPELPHAGISPLWEH